VKAATSSRLTLRVKPTKYTQQSLVLYKFAVILYELMHFETTTKEGDGVENSVKNG